MSDVQQEMLQEIQRLHIRVETLNKEVEESLQQFCMTFEISLNDLV